MFTAGEFVTVPVPVGVNVTVYVRGGAELPPPHEIRKPASARVSAVSSTASVRLRRSVNGAPSSTAQNITAPPLFHGTAGAWFAALVVVVMVTVEVPPPPAASVTGDALAEIDGELTLVAKFTVPA
jgi:hypothetical protein